MANYGNLATEHSLVADLSNMFHDHPLVANFGNLAKEQPLVVDKNIASLWLIPETLHGSTPWWPIMATWKQSTPSGASLGCQFWHIYLGVPPNAQIGHYT